MELAGKKVLVTGAAGFIGSHLSDELARHCDLILVDDYSVGSRENLAQLPDNPTQQPRNRRRTEHISGAAVGTPARRLFPDVQ